MTREALKLALEALEHEADKGNDDAYKVERDAIKKALAQPEQDGKCKYCTDGCPACDARKLPEHIGFIDSKLNPIQRTWVGLTDEEILDNCESVPDYDIGNYDLIQFAQAIEAKLKEKNHG